MMTVEQIQFLLALIRKEFGHGYSDVREVGILQAHLSIQLEVANTLNRHSDPIEIPSVVEAQKKAMKKQKHKRKRKAN